MPACASASPAFGSLALVLSICETDATHITCHRAWVSNEFGDRLAIAAKRTGEFDHLGDQVPRLDAAQSERSSDRADAPDHFQVKEGLDDVIQFHPYGELSAAALALGSSQANAGSQLPALDAERCYSPGPH